MDILQNLATGFGAALSLNNLGICLAGCLLGTLIGVLPGIGPIPTIAMLLPITFGLDPLASLIMLAGIYYGAQYGGSTTSILVFGFLIESIGLALTALLLTIFAGFARHDVKLRESILLGIGLGVFTVVVFVYVLGQALPAWWGR